MFGRSIGPGKETATGDERHRGWVVAIACVVCLLCAVEPCSSIGAGVNPGDWATWSVETRWSPGPLPQEEAPIVAEYGLNLTTVRAYVLWVRSPIVVYDLTARWLDGSARTVQPRVNLSSGDLGGSISDLSLQGFPGLALYLIGSSLDAGDSVRIWWRGEPRRLIVESLDSGRYGGATRQVLTAQYNGSSGNVTELLSGKWDQSTGMLCEATLVLEGPDWSLQTSILLSGTSRWGIVRRSNWPVLALVVIVVAVTSALVVRSQLSAKRKQGANQAPTTHDSSHPTTREGNQDPTR